MSSHLNKLDQSNPQNTQSPSSTDTNEASENINLTTRKKFSFEEDEKLKYLVKKHGSRKWDIIAREIPGRTGRQCRDRYMNYLVPGFFNGQWSKKEDELLLEKYVEFGSQWSKITKFFPGRSANSLKNRWNYFVSKHLVTDEVLEKLIKNKNEKSDDIAKNNEAMQIKNKEIENIINYASSYECFVVSYENNAENGEKSHNFPFVFNDII